MFRYKKAKLLDGVTRIKDGIVNEFLIEGGEKAVLFDTGLDLFNIKDYVAKLTDKKLIVLASVCSRRKKQALLCRRPECKAPSVHLDLLGASV